MPIPNVWLLSQRLSLTSTARTLKMNMRIYAAGQERNVMKHRRIGYIILIVGCALPIMLLIGIFIRGQKDISERENRALSSFPVFSVSSFTSGEYQSTLENALGDQYPYGDEIKGMVLTAQSSISSLEGNLLRQVFSVSNNVYEEIAPGYYHFAKDDHRIVEKPWAVGTDIERLKGNAVSFNALTGVKKYLYFIRNSRSQDFSKTDAENDRIYQMVCEAYQPDKSACFAAADYEEFCRLFYQTDHHWNHIGADRGYREIMQLFGLEDECLSPDREWVFDVVFNGSYARKTKKLCADEKFAAFVYPISRMKISLNGKKGQYGHASLYEKNKFPTDELRNHYAYYYGGDYGEILIDNGHEKKRNLLIMADSYSNPINMLIASHFDQTCVIDLRYYEQDMGMSFDLASYVQEHHIDTVLMLGDIALFAGAQEEGANS